MLGRDDELARVREALGEAPTSAGGPGGPGGAGGAGGPGGAGDAGVVIFGPAGVGKTRLALAVAAAGEDVAWVDLAPVTEPRLVMAEIARALGVSAAADVAAAIDRDILLIVDNCEHLFEAMPALGDLLAATSRLRVLATSRERLRLAA